MPSSLLHLSPVVEKNLTLIDSSSTTRLALGSAAHRRRRRSRAPVLSSRPKLASPTRLPLRSSLAGTATPGSRAPAVAAAGPRRRRRPSTNADLPAVSPRPPTSAVLHSSLGLSTAVTPLLPPVSKET